MRLTEVEAKALFTAAGLTVPASQLLSQVPTTTIAVKFPVMVKAQVLHGNRGLQGLIKPATTEAELKTVVAELLAATDEYGQPITQVLVEEQVTIDQEHYLSFSYSTRDRAIVINYSQAGGAGMDDRGGSVTTTVVSALAPPTEFAAAPELLPVVQALYQVFTTNDATTVEVNPLVKTKQGWLCLDGKVELEDTAAGRHPEWATYPERSQLGRSPTPRELKAHQVSHTDHRGVAGESFFEFTGGEIGVMASGGGASTLAMDALMAEGLKPANYTEYSGNPTREKVKALTEVVLSIPGLRGLYVVGSNANFTDIYDTLAGVIDGLLESPYQGDGFAILVRRGGPRWQEAFEMVTERLAGKQYRLKLLGPDFPLVETATEMRKLIEGPEISTQRST